MAQDKYTKSARNQECQIRVPGVCNRNPETTVFAHLNGAGMGYKFPNIIGSYACSSCHDAVDYRANNKNYSEDELKLMLLEGMIRTQMIMIREGILEL